MTEESERLLAAFREMRDPKIRSFYLKLGETLAGIAPLSELPVADFKFTDLSKTPR